MSERGDEVRDEQEASAGEVSASASEPVEEASTGSEVSAAAPVEEQKAEQEEQSKKEDVAPVKRSRERRPDPLVPVSEMRRSAFRWRSRRDFLVMGVGAVGLFALWKWILNGRQIEDAPWVLRRALDFNADVSQDLLGTGRLARTYPADDAVAVMRVNGDIGLSDVDAAQWRLQLVGIRDAEKYPQYVKDVNAWDYGDSESSDESDAEPDRKSAGGIASGVIPQSPPAAPVAQPGLLLTMEDLRALPYAETVTQFKCIEGWSVIVRWGGVRMEDLMKAYPPVDAKYAGLETPSGDFYTGMDMATMRHPQTLLAYALNGQPLPAENGAPLRLATPLKYGYKQLKQIAKLEYTNVKPRDYWAEQGYDWYAGH
jgi:hypothetical protein